MTRDSILSLARSGALGGSVETSERWLRMSEVVEAQKEGRLLEVFGAGTAVVISPVKCIVYKDMEINVPTAEGVGDIALRSSAIYLNAYIYIKYIGRSLFFFPH